MPSLRQPAEVLALPTQRNQNSAACRGPEPRQQRIDSLEVKTDLILIPAIDPELAMHIEQSIATGEESQGPSLTRKYEKCYEMISSRPQTKLKA